MNIKNCSTSKWILISSVHQVKNEYSKVQCIKINIKKFSASKCIWKSLVHQNEFSTSKWILKSLVHQKWILIIQ